MVTCAMADPGLIKAFVVVTYTRADPGLITALVVVNYAYARADPDLITALGDRSILALVRHSVWKARYGL